MKATKLQIVSCLILCFLRVSIAYGWGSSSNSLSNSTSAAQVYRRFDAGKLAPDTKLRRMRVILAQDMLKRNALQTLLAQQQDPHSGTYHKWISPREYGERFGADEHTTLAVQQWLVQSGMENVEISHGRNYVAFSGSVTAVERAMHVELHSYRLRRETHYANTKPPLIPPGLSNVVAMVEGLDDFVPRSAPHPALKGQYVSGAGVQSLGPADLAAIYDIQPLYHAGIDGSRSTIAIVGAAVASLADFRAYKQMFGLPANDFLSVIVPGSGAATSSGGEAIEAALDLEVAGAIAPQAKLTYVQDDDILGAVAYVIDNKLSDVISMSYTVCELPGPEDTAYETLALQGMAEGITWVNASGDSGAAACDQAGSTAATSGLAVNLPASLPEVTGVGGTAFVNSNSSQYWAAGNTTSGATALGYVPELAWNASSDGLSVTASGGGVSKDFYRPGYQSFIDDGQLYREVPDLSFAASQADPPYLIVTGGQVYYVGGTSAAAPLFAGISALLNDYRLANGITTESGLGNLNAQLYRLAQSDPDAFHDVTNGNNQVVCAEGSLDCTSGSLGYPAGLGYDMATGLGSLDVYKLASDWDSADLGSSTVTLLSGPLDGSGERTFTATVTAATAPTAGVVVFSWTNAAYLNMPIEFSRVPLGNDGLATATFAGLPVGANLVTAAFQGTTGLLGSVSNALIVNVGAVGVPKATVSMLDAQAQVSANDYLPLSAAIAGSGAPPTGTVTFYLGATLMGTASVVDGVAMTLSSHLPVVGTSALIAHYSGDASYAAAVSAPFSLSVLAPTAPLPEPAATPDFTLTAPSALTLTAGESGTIALTLAPQHGFAQTIQFACTGVVAGYGCTPPAAVTPKGNMTLTANLAAQAVAFLPLALLLLAQKARRCVFASALLLMLSGCGYHVNKAGEAVAAAASNAGTYTVTITATSGALIHTVVVTVIIQ